MRRDAQPRAQNLRLAFLPSSVFTAGSHRSLLPFPPTPAATPRRHQLHQLLLVRCLPRGRRCDFPIVDSRAQPSLKFSLAELGAQAASLRLAAAPAAMPAVILTTVATSTAAFVSVCHIFSARLRYDSSFLTCIRHPFTNHSIPFLDVPYDSPLAHHDSHPSHIYSSKPLVLIFSFELVPAQLRLFDP